MVRVYTVVAQSLELCRSPVEVATQLLGSIERVSRFDASFHAEFAYASGLFILVWWNTGKSRVEEVGVIFGEIGLVVCALVGFMRYLYFGVMRAFMSLPVRSMSSMWDYLPLLPVKISEAVCKVVLLHLLHNWTSKTRERWWSIIVHGNRLERYTVLRMFSAQV